MKPETCLQCQSLKPCSANIAVCTQHHLQIYRCEAKKCRVCDRLCKKNYYLCQIGKTCLDREECRAFVIAQTDEKAGFCHQTVDSEGFHYEFETMREFDLRHAVREEWKRSARGEGRRRTT